MLLICTGCTAQTPSSTASPRPESVAESSLLEGFGQLPTDRAEIPFDQMEYIQPDLEATIAQYEDFARRVQNAGSADEVMSVWKEEAQLCKDYYNMYTLSNVLFSLDTSNEENAENYQYMQDFLAKLKPAAVSLIPLYPAVPVSQSNQRDRWLPCVGRHGNRRQKLF